MEVIHGFEPKTVRFQPFLPVRKSKEAIAVDSAEDIICWVGNSKVSAPRLRKLLQSVRYFELIEVALQNSYL